MGEALIFSAVLLPQSRGGNPIAMRSFRRLACILAVILPAISAAYGQSPSTSSSTQAQQPASQNQGEMTVQARIRMRREQRRATAIHDAYDHLFDAYAGMGYLRFTPGPNKQRLTYYSWNIGLTRYYSERLGISLDGRGNYGTAFVNLNQYGLTRPAISQYDVMLGPSYRFYLQPKYAIAGRVMGGWTHGNFSADTNRLGSTTLGLYPDGDTFVVSVGIIGEYNLTPSFALRLAPEYVATGFGSSMQNSRGFTSGFVYRFGKQ